VERNRVANGNEKKHLHMLLGNVICFVSLLGKSKLWLHIDRISWGK